MRTDDETPKAAARRLSAAMIAEGYKAAALHAYRNADGLTLFYRIRLKHPGTGDKWIRPMHHNGHAFVIGEPPAPAIGKPLYRLPELLADAGPVYVVEGEACADALAGLGVIATTSGSADSADAADWSPLRGREMVIWPDNDKAGERYARAVAAKLRGIAASVEWIDSAPLALPEHGDCVDWLAQHPDATAETVHTLARAPAPDPSPPPVSTGSAPRVILRAACEVEPQPVDWLWPGWLAAGKLHLIGGAPGTGKTTVAVGLAAIVSAGGRWPDGSRARAGSVVIWSGEDDDADTLNPRLRAAGADTRHVRTVGRMVDGGESYPFDPARDLDALCDALRAIRDVRLLVIDPVVSAVSGDSHKNAEVRRGLQPLVDLAGELGCAVLGITHFSKGTSGRDPVERITGSVAFGALARVVLVTAKQDEDGDRPARRVLLRAKCNIGPDGGGFVYELRQEPLPDFPNVEASRVIWGEMIDGTAREVLADAEAQGEEVEERRDAASWLRQLLAGGPLTAKDIKRQADDAGHAWRTVQRAMRIAGVESKRDGFGGAALWRLVNRAKPAPFAPVAPHSESGANGATGADQGAAGEAIEL
ncbi:MAG: AAA family ATPase [Lysobacter sp.]|nr:AAA family ATPase [Lysobacter sp.]